MLTEFGKKVRKGRIDAGVTLLQMADALSTSPAFLSGMETGRKKVPENWVKAIDTYFVSRGVKLDDLDVAASVSNQTVSLDGLSREHQMLVAGFARVQSSSLSGEDVEKFRNFLASFQGK